MSQADRAPHELCRRVHPGGAPLFYDSSRRPNPLHWTSLKPSDDDYDGVSLVRRQHRRDIWAAYNANQPDVRYRLVILDQQVLEKIGSDNGFKVLEFAITPDLIDCETGEPYAHVSIREINTADYKADMKRAIKQWAMDVTASVNNTQLYGPFEPPGEVPYRW